MPNPGCSSNPRPLTSLGKLPDWQRDRALLLHRICSELTTAQAEGKSLHREIVRAVKKYRRARLGLAEKPFRISKSRLYFLHERWLENPTPLAFVLGYRSGRHCPAGLVREYIRRCLQRNSSSVVAVFEKLESDWKAGRSIPGLGTWRTWARKHLDEMSFEPPAFPYSRRTLTRRFSQRDLQNLRRLRQRHSALADRLEKARSEAAAEIAAFEFESFSRISSNAGAQPKGILS